MNSSWLKYLPAAIRGKLEGRHTLQMALSNAGWLLADKSLRMGVGLIVGVWIARYLGPQKYGLLNYSIAFAALFGAFATLGLDGIVIRELAKYPERKDILLGSAFVLKILGAFVAVFTAILSIAIIKVGESLTIWLVSITAVGFIFQSINVIDFFFQSKVRSKYTVIAANVAFLLITLVKLALLTYSAPLICFAGAGLGEIVLSMAFLLVAYRVDHNHIRSWRYDHRTANELIRNSWPLIFATFALIIQARIDTVMLGDMINSQEVGQFSVAMRLFEVFSFVPMVIISTLSPHVAKAKAAGESLYFKRLLEVYRAMTITFLLIAIPIFIFGERIVILMFGVEYKRAGVLLSLFAVRQFFTNFGVAKTLFITNESLFRYSLITLIVGAAINIFANYFLIPYYRSEGAIVATIISFTVTTFVIDAFYSRTRANLKLMISAVFNPFGFRRINEN